MWRIRDPVPYIFDSWIRDPDPAYYQFFGLKIFDFFFADPDPGSSQPWIQDGIKWIRDKHPGSATLPDSTKKILDAD